MYLLKNLRLLLSLTQTKKSKVAEHWLLVASPITMKNTCTWMVNIQVSSRLKVRISDGPEILSNVNLKQCLVIFNKPCAKTVILRQLFLDTQLRQKLPQKSPTGIFIRQMNE